MFTQKKKKNEDPRPLRTVAIHQPSYLVWPPLLEKMALADHFLYLDDVEYSSRSEIQRNRVLGPSGWKWLSVPTHSPRGCLINEVITAGSTWKYAHWKTFSHFYGKAPYFRGELRESFAAQYVPGQRTDQELLVEVNIRSTEWLRDRLGIQTPTSRTSELDVRSKGSRRVLDLCLAVGATRYLTGPGAYDYLDFASFAEAGVEVLVQNYRHVPYPQLFAHQEFVPRMSAVDMLFNVGPSCLEGILARGVWETVNQYQAVPGP